MNDRWVTCCCISMNNRPSYCFLAVSQFVKLRMGYQALDNGSFAISLLIYLYMFPSCTWSVPVIRRREGLCLIVVFFTSTSLNYNLFHALSAILVRSSPNIFIKSFRSIACEKGTYSKNKYYIEYPVYRSTKLNL